MDAKGVLPKFKGILCHDHWTDFCSCKICIPPSLAVKPDYHYTGCLHSLCNAHHLRELERAFEQDGQQWAKAM
jgi:transposase